jgi:hypothetical protein
MNNKSTHLIIFYCTNCGREDEPKIYGTFARVNECECGSKLHFITYTEDEIEDVNKILESNRKKFK